MKTVNIDRGQCIGCGACAATCPEIFSIKEDPKNNRDMKSFANEKVDAEKYADMVEQAISVCPVSCISWKK